MFIAIIGTRFSGKSSIENYLVATKGFKSVRLVQSNPEYDFSVLEEKFEVGDLPASKGDLSNLLFYNNQVIDSQTPLSSDSTFSLDDSSSCTDPNLTRNLSFLSMGSVPSPGPTPQQTLCFSTPGELLDYVTYNWQNNYVTVDLNTRELVELFIRRPFFNLLCCDAPLMERFNRSKRYGFFGLT
jgi:dCMP deaminase